MSVFFGLQWRTLARSICDDLTAWSGELWALQSNDNDDIEIVCGTVDGDIQVALTPSSLARGPAVRVQLRYRVPSKGGDEQALFGQRYPFHPADPQPVTHLRRVANDALDLRTRALQLRECVRAEGGESLPAPQGEIAAPPGPIATDDRMWWEQLASALTAWSGEHWCVEPEHGQWSVRIGSVLDVPTFSVHLTRPFLAHALQVDLRWTQRVRTQPDAAPAPDELRELVADLVELEGLSAYLAGVFAFRAHMAAPASGGTT